MARAISNVAREIFERVMSSNSYGSFALKHVKLLAAEEGQCKAEMTVQEEHLNLGGTLHGGMTSGLVDALSTLALSTYKTGATGVSVDLHITFLKAAYPGEVVSIDARTIRAGRTMAFLEVELTKQKDGSLVARGQHTKYLGS